MKYSELPNKFCCIYKIDFPNNKIYVGRAIDVKRRIWEHYNKKDNTPCQRALKKYYNSYLDIEVSILEEIKDYSLIYEAEKQWIKKYDCLNKEKGYNITSGGDGGGVGIYNSASKFTKEDLDNIYKLLEEQRTNIYISELYNVHPDTIGKINQGKTYFDKNRNYPIRKGQGIVEYKDKFNSFTQEQLDLALYLLSTTKENYEKIGELTSISKSVLTSLNLGKHPYCQNLNLNFPIRKNRRSIKLNDQDVIEIKKDLLNPNLSIQDIANKYQCDRSTIGDINQGKRYSNSEEKYPIRNFYPKRGAKKPVQTILGSEE